MNSPEPVDSVVCFKWRPRPGYRSTYGPESVNVLYRMVRRHYPHRQRFICVTDDAAGLDPKVEVVPLWSDFRDLPPPRPGHPACYPRLKLFDPAIGALLGRRFVAVDLDCVITGDLTPVWNRCEDLVLWGGTNPLTTYNGSMQLQTAGCRPSVWERFSRDPAAAIAGARRFFGSDQAVLSWALGPNEARWTQSDGVYSFRNDIRRTGVLARTARIVLFHGKVDPWDLTTKLQWVKDHYR